MNDREEKLRWDLLPVGPLHKLVEVYTIGARKYADHNWRKGLAYSRVYAAMMRHAWAWWNGEQNDPEDGQHHLASVAWCALTLIELEVTHPECDDRYRVVVAPIEDDLIDADVIDDREWEIEVCPDCGAQMTVISGKGQNFWLVCHQGHAHLRSELETVKVKPV